MPFDNLSRIVENSADSEWSNESVDGILMPGKILEVK